MRLSGFICLATASLTAAQGDLVAFLQSQPNLSTLLSLVQLAGLNSTLSTLTNVTILAPTNQAFAAINPNVPEGIAVNNRNATSVAALLANHVFNGSYPASAITEVPTFAQTLLTPEYQNDIQPFTDITGGQYNGLVRNGGNVSILSGEFTVSNVVQADLRLGPGIIVHVIDNTLSFGPPLQLFTARNELTAFNGLFSQYGPNLSLGLTGPSGVPSGSEDLTIFVPINEAFSRIGSVVNTANPETIQSVLSYHVISNNIVFSPSLSNTSVPSLQGTNLTFSVLPNGSAFVNGARIVIPNVILSNGVCHIIDNVLNPAPPAFNRASYDFNAAAASRTAFTGATSVSVTASAATFATATVEASSIPAIFTTGQIVAIATPTTAPPATFTGGAAKVGFNPAIIGLGALIGNAVLRL